MSVHLKLEGQPSPFLSLRLAMMLVFHCKVRWRERKGGIQTRMMMMMCLWWTRSQHSRHCSPPLSRCNPNSLSRSLKVYLVLVSSFELSQMQLGETSLFLLIFILLQFFSFLMSSILRKMHWTWLKEAGQWYAKVHDFQIRWGNCRRSLEDDEESDDFKT